MPRQFGCLWLVLRISWINQPLHGRGPWVDSDFELAHAENENQGLSGRLSVNDPAKLPGR